MFLFRSFLSFRLIVFRLILVSPSSFLVSSPCFPWWRIMLFCYFVLALHPPRTLCEPEVYVCVFPLRAVLSLAFLMLIYSIFLLFPFLDFFDFDLDIVCFILSFSCGYHAVSLVSVSAATRLAYSYYIYICISIRTCADLTFFFFSLRGIRFFSVIVCIIACYYLFSS